MKLLFDFFPILLFFAAFKLYDIYVATAVTIAATCVQVGWAWYKHRKVEPMLLVTLGVVVLFGGATILLHDDTFVKWKPTIVDWIFALVFLVSQFFGEKPMVERLMGGNITLPDAIWKRVNLGWAIFFLLGGLANLYVAFYYKLELPAEARQEIWVNFKAFGMMGLTVLFVLAQGFYLARYVNPEPSPENNIEKEP